MNDFTIENHGSIVLLRPLTAAAEAWLEENLATESWQWFGGAVAIEPRYAEAILAGIAEAF